MNIIDVEKYLKRKCFIKIEQNKLATIILF